MTLFELSYAALWAIALMLGILTAVLLNQFASILRLADENKKRRRVAGSLALTVGMPLPKLRGRDLREGVVRNSSEWNGAPFVVLALSPSCSSCKRISEELQGAQDVPEKGTALVGLCVGEQPTCASGLLSTLRSITVLAVTEGEVPEIAGKGLPLAISVNSAGKVNDMRHPHSLTEVLGMLNATLSDRASDTSVPARAAS